jgi:glyoxylase-like metal-dependent hydrolase (beta-lactamase superfamily II)
MRANYGRPATVEVGLGGGEELRVGGRRLEVHHAPGHSAGHLVLYEPATGMLFSSDAVHWRMCPAAGGEPALPPTYEDVDPYLATIDMIGRLGVRELHSGHWPARAGAEVAAFLDESRAFVGRMDAAVLDLAERPATLAELCRGVDAALGPFGCDPVNLMFAVHGHLRRLVRQGRVRVAAAGERPPRYVRA